MRTRVGRTLAGVGLAAALAAGLAPAASAAEIMVGPFVVQVPDLAPVPVPVPLGSEAAPLPMLPYPLEWDRPAPPPPPPFDPFSGRTLALDCGANPERMPSTIIIFCGDGNGQFQNIHWTSWQNDRAEGTADKVWVECVPACYNGIRRSKPARITLHDVRNTSAGPAFAKLTSHDDLGSRTTAMSSFRFEPGDQVIFP